MNKFKIGDEVVAVQNHTILESQWLTKDKVYEVLLYKGNEPVVKTDNGAEVSFFEWRFKLLVQTKIHHYNTGTRQVILVKSKYSTTSVILEVPISQYLINLDWYPYEVTYFDEELNISKVEIVEKMLTFGALKVGEKFNFTHTDSATTNCMKCSLNNGGVGWIILDDTSVVKATDEALSYSVERA